MMDDWIMRMTLFIAVFCDNMLGIFPLMFSLRVIHLIYSDDKIVMLSYCKSQGEIKHCL